MVGVSATNVMCSLDDWTDGDKNEEKSARSLRHRKSRRHVVLQVTCSDHGFFHPKASTITSSDWPTGTSSPPS